MPKSIEPSGYIFSVPTKFYLRRRYRQVGFITFGLSNPSAIIIYGSLIWIWHPFDIKLSSKYFSKCIFCVMRSYTAWNDKLEKCNYAHLRCHQFYDDCPSPWHMLFLPSLGPIDTTDDRKFNPWTWHDGFTSFHFGLYDSKHIFNEGQHNIKVVIAIVTVILY